MSSDNCCQVEQTLLYSLVLLLKTLQASPGTMNMIIYNSKTKNLITWPWRPSPRRPPCREPTPPSSPSPPCPRPDQGVNADADAGNEPGRGIEPPPTRSEETPFSLPSLAPFQQSQFFSFLINYGFSQIISATNFEQLLIGTKVKLLI